MTRAVLLAFLTLCFARVSLVTAAAKKPATCAAGETTMVKVADVGEVPFVCPQGLDLAADLPEGSPDQGAVFLDTDVNTNATEAISKVVPGATIAAVPKGGQGHVVTITQLPGSATTFYIRCHTKSGLVKQDVCHIGIEVAASPRLGPNTCAVPGSRINFTVEKATEVVQFGCGVGTELQPSDPKQAFNDSCSEATPLPEDVVMTSKDGTHMLTVQKLPSKLTVICYVCAGKDPKNRRCEVHISIAGSERSAAASVGIAARTAAALGFVLAAVALQRVS